MNKGPVLLLGLILLTAGMSDGQTAATRDSTVADSVQLSQRYRLLFRKEWSDEFVKAWNANKDTARVMAGLGRVYFISTSGSDSATLLMNFDSVGSASVVSTAPPASSDTLPKFTTTLVRWAQFMEGKFGAVMGVLTKKILYHGPMTIAFKYGWQFDKVAPVGRRIVEALNRKTSKHPEKTE